MKKTIIIVLSFLVVVACNTTKKTTTTATTGMTQADAERGALKFSGLTLADLNEGKNICDANCGKCHELFKPQSRDEKGWNEIVPGMVKKANYKAGGEAIDAKKQELLLKYLVIMSSK